MVVNECYALCPPAQCLKAQSAGAGKEIKDVGTGNVAADDVEQGLPGTIGGRPDKLTVSWRGKELPASGPSADNSQELTIRKEKLVMSSTAVWILDTARLSEDRAVSGW